MGKSQELATGTEYLIISREGNVMTFPALVVLAGGHLC